jgi:hypothetical protein
MFKIAGSMIARDNEDGTTSYIPMDEANTDYQAYLEWLEAGNEPEIIES